MLGFELTEEEKKRGLSLPQAVITWWYSLSSKKKLELELKYNHKPIIGDSMVWKVYKAEFPHLVRAEYKEILVKKYKVGDYEFEDKEQAIKIAYVITNPDQKVCPECKGVGKTWGTIPRSMDNGGEGYTQYFAHYQRCTKCNGKGFLEKKIDWK